MDTKIAKHILFRIFLGKKIKPLQFVAKNGMDLPRRPMGRCKMTL